MILSALYTCAFNQCDKKKNQSKPNAPTISILTFAAHILLPRIPTCI